MQVNESVCCCDVTANSNAPAAPSSKAMQQVIIQGVIVLLSVDISLTFFELLLVVQYYLLTKSHPEMSRMKLEKDAN